MKHKEFGIYIHIPFCERKCVYCDFASFSSKETVIKDYFNRLKEEILQFDGEYEVSTVYFGGGTPSSVDVEYIDEIFKTLKSKFKLKKHIEATIECNPNSISKEKLLKYRKMGFNRISIGIQSFDNEILKVMGRLHDSNQAISAIKLAKEAGFKNISVDLMFGFRGQKIENIQQDIKLLSDLDVSHISAYMLQIEEKTPLYKMLKNNELKILSEDECESLYSKAVKILEDYGYKRYEISNFARNGQESRHNRNYWLLSEYVGFGLGAHSYLNNKRISNSKLLSNYSKNLDIKTENLSNNDKITEKIMLGLRCRFGVLIKDLNKLGYDIEKNPNFEIYIKNEILFRVGNKFFLNPIYYNVSNSIICNLIP